MYKRKIDDTAARSVVDRSIEELLCPITLHLPLEPVAAEDGRVYEKDAIETWLAKSDRSPVTNLPMGKKVFPVIQICSIIQHIAAHTVPVPEQVADWKQRKQQKQKREALVRKAEECENVDLMYFVGVMYKKSKYGMPQDISKSRLWFERAAKAGHLHSMDALALMYFYGPGDKSLTLALRWASAAVATGRECDAYNVLARFYLDGLVGIPRDDAEGFRLYAAYPNRKNSRGLYRLGELHEHGVGTVANLDKASECMRRAITHGSPADYVRQARAWLLEHDLGTWQTLTVPSVNAIYDMYYIGKSEEHPACLASVLTEAGDTFTTALWDVATGQHIRTERRNHIGEGGIDSTRRDSSSPATCCHIRGCKAVYSRGSTSRTIPMHTDIQLLCLVPASTHHPECLAIATTDNKITLSIL